jgi:formiminotetrahydrofolate cyclodeaminase
MRGMQLDLHGLAARKSDPAAGAAVAVTAAQGAALLTMSLRYVAPGAADTVTAALRAAEKSIDAFAAMPRRDGACFAPVAAALAMVQGDEAARDARAEALARALPGASAVLEELVEQVGCVLAAAVPAAPSIPAAVAGDCAVAVELLRAAAHSAALLARSNATLFRDEAQALELVERFEAAEAEAERHAHALRAVLDLRLTR